MTTKRRPTTKHPRGSGWRSLVALLSTSSALCVYLFVTAPAPLSAGTTVERRPVSVRVVLSLLELENDAARALWTEEIVNRGTAAGLAFGERWREPAVHEGPLPALFLRETARELAREVPGLSVFLGSRHPINQANRLSGRQATELEQLERTGVPRYFLDADTHLHTAMFADHATVEGCASCHNEHRESPKHDWRLGDVMGATTWMYPEDAVTVERALEMIGALRASIRASYERYLEKVATFPRRPEIGTRWPKQGYFLPTADVFMQELAGRSAPATIAGLIDPEAALTAARATPIVRRAPAATPEPAPARKRRAPPTLVIRSKRSTRVTVDRDDSRLMITRLPAGGSASLTSRPPLRVRLSRATGVEIEYAGRTVPVPEPREDEDAGEVEVVVPAVLEKS